MVGAIAATTASPTASWLCAATAPDANVIVCQAPNIDPGFADACFDVASQNPGPSMAGFVLGSVSRIDPVHVARCR
jgi:hypothetical protein